MLDQFVRLEGSRSRPGSGLGLSLAAAVARMHGGTVALEDNRPGLRVRLTLPATDDRPNRWPARSWFWMTAPLAEGVVEAPRLSASGEARRSLAALLDTLVGRGARART